MYGQMQVQQLKRHPIRGALFGLVFGLGVALFLIGQKIVAFGTLPPILAVVGGLVLGLLWSLFGPAKEAVGAPPVRQQVIAPDSHLGGRWSDDPNLAPEGQYGVPVGGSGVPGGEHADPIAYDAPTEPYDGETSPIPPPPSAPSSPPPPPPPPAR